MYLGHPFAILRCFKPFPNCTQVYNCTSGGTNPITWGQLQPLGLASCRSVTSPRHCLRHHFTGLGHHHDCPHHPGGFRSRVSSVTPTPPPGRATASTGYFRWEWQRCTGVTETGVTETGVTGTGVTETGVTEKYRVRQPVCGCSVQG